MVEFIVLTLAIILLIVIPIYVSIRAIKRENKFDRFLMGLEDKDTKGGENNDKVI